MSNKYENQYFVKVMCALVFIMLVTLLVTFSDYSKVKKENQTLKQNADSSGFKPMPNEKLVKDILKNIEDYYLVHKKDTKLIRTIRLDKTKIDTIYINNGTVRKNN